MEARSFNPGLSVSPPKLGKMVPQEDVNITLRMKNDSQVRALKAKVKGLHGNMNDLEKNLKSLQVSSATKAMIQGVTVNMENHIDSLRRQFQAELKASCSDFVKYDEAYNDFQRKVDFTQLVTRMDKLIRSKVKDVFIYEAEPIFQRLWAKREKQLVGACWYEEDETYRKPRHTEWARSPCKSESRKQCSGSSCIASVAG